MAGGCLARDSVRPRDTEAALSYDTATSAHYIRVNLAQTAELCSQAGSRLASAQSQAAVDEDAVEEAGDVMVSTPCA